MINELFLSRVLILLDCLGKASILYEFQTRCFIPELSVLLQELGVALDGHKASRGIDQHHSGGGFVDAMSEYHVAQAASLPGALTLSREPLENLVGIAVPILNEGATEHFVLVSLNM